MKKENNIRSCHSKILEDHLKLYRNQLKKDQQIKGRIYNKIVQLNNNIQKQENIRININKK